MIEDRAFVVNEPSYFNYVIEKVNYRRIRSSSVDHDQAKSHDCSIFKCNLLERGELFLHFLWKLAYWIDRSLQVSLFRKLYNRYNTDLRLIKMIALINPQCDISRPMESLGDQKSARK